MANKEMNKNDENLAHVQDTLSKSETFIENNHKQISYLLGGIVIVVLAVLAVRNFYLRPREQEAADKMTLCTRYFERDSFNTALNGDGLNEGFAEIASHYTFTKSAKLAAFYAGVCSYHLGQYNEAIDYLKKANLKSVNLTPIGEGLMGDCYVELDNAAEAVKHFEAAAKIDNEMTAPIYLKKAALAYEALGNYDKALQYYETIKNKYFNSRQATEADRFIERAKALKK